MFKKIFADRPKTESNLDFIGGSKRLDPDLHLWLELTESRERTRGKGSSKLEFIDE